MMKIQTRSCVVNGKYDVAVVEQEVEYQGTGTLGENHSWRNLRFRSALLPGR